MENKNIQKRSKTELVLTNIYNLPSIPKVMLEALKLLDSKSTNTQELSKIISRDQGLVTKILTIANSPLYGLQRKVTSIDFAVLILGFGELRNLISIISMMETFKNKTDKYLDQKTFWQHSFLSGCAAKKLAEDFGFPNSGEAFIAGFLHDLGLSVMHKYLHSNYIAVHDAVSSNLSTQEEAEKEILGMTHEEIGYFLLERWNFPTALCDSILNHHKPGNSRDNVFLSSILQLSDYMATRFADTKFFWDENIELDPETMKCLRFHSQEEVEKFMLNYENLFTSQLESARYFN